MNTYQLTFTFHKSHQTTFRLEVEAKNERVALTEALGDIDWKDTYKDLNIKMITIYRIK